MSASVSWVERRIDSHPERTLLALRRRLLAGKIPAVAAKNAIFVYVCELFGLIEKVYWFSAQRKLILQTTAHSRAYITRLSESAGHLTKVLHV